MKSSASALHIKATRFITGNRRPLWLAPSLTSEYGLPDLDFRCRLPDLHCKPPDLIRGQNAPPQQPALTGAHCGGRAVYGLTFELGLRASGFKFRLPVLDFRIWTSGFKLPELGPGASPFATAKSSARGSPHLLLQKIFRCLAFFLLLSELPGQSQTSPGVRGAHQAKRSGNFAPKKFVLPVWQDAKLFPGYLVFLF